MGTPFRNPVITLCHRDPVALDLHHLSLHNSQISAQTLPVAGPQTQTWPLAAVAWTLPWPLISYICLFFTINVSPGPPLSTVHESVSFSHSSHHLRLPLSHLSITYLLIIVVPASGQGKCLLGVLFMAAWVGPFFSPMRSS